MKKLLKLFLSLVLTFSCLLGFNMIISVNAIETGLTISENVDYPDSDADYQVTFTYQAADDVEKVELVGGFTFYTTDQESDYVNGNAITYYTPYQYKEGMFPTGYAVSEFAYAPIAMENIEDNIWSVTLPLPGFQYFYGFQLTYNDGTTKTVKDPTNMPVANGDSDSGWSLFYLGNSTDCIEGQKYVYPRTDGKTGTVEYVEYTAVDGTTQPLGIYLPNGYDTSKTYKTIYLSHGGGGNEVEWMNIGSAQNIMDNLIAEGEVADAIVVTMDNTYFDFEAGDSLKNIVECVIPFVEQNYSVSTDAKDRAMAGLSSGATVTVQAMLYSNDTFAYYGVFSPSRTLDFVNETLTDEMKNNFKNATQYYVSVGIYDSFVRRDVNVQVYEELQSAGANVVFKWKNGAHDWGVWRNQFSEFVKDYLWDTDSETPSVSPEKTNDTEQANDTQPSNTASTSVKTGDSTNAMLYFVCIILAGSLGFVGFKKIKE